MSVHILLVSKRQVPPNLSELLQLRNFQLEIVTHLEPALESIKQGIFRYVVLDVAPDERLNVSTQLKQQAEFDKLLIVVENSSAARADALAVGADDLLTEPLDPVELVLRLDQLTQYKPNNWLGIAEILQHDLKSPVSLIVSSLELVHDLMKESQSEYLPFVGNSLIAARRQAVLIEDLVDYLLIHQVNQLPYLQIEPIDLTWVEQELRKNIDPLLRNKLVEFSLTFPPDAPKVLADGELLVRILTALVDNALKFCVKGDTLSVKADIKKRVARITVTDSGREILPEYASRIFDLDDQTIARRDGSRSSVAMGLPFAKVATQLLNGKLMAATQNGLTTFTCTIPLV